MDAANRAFDAQSTASGVVSGAGGAPEPEARSPEHVAWWRALRLRLWRHSDRLELLHAAQGRWVHP